MASRGSNSNSSHEESTEQLQLPVLSQSPSAPLVSPELASIIMGSSGIKSSGPYPLPPRPMEIMESIKGLHELHQKGGLTEEEFTQAKQQILNSSSSSSTSSSSAVSQQQRPRAKRRRRRARRSRSTVSLATSVSPHDDVNPDIAVAQSSPPGLRRAASRTPRSSRRSSSTSSSSSSSSSDHFIVVPRAKVWRTLGTDDFPDDQESAGGHSSAHGDDFSATNDGAVHSPLLGDTGSAGYGSDASAVKRAEDSAAEWRHRRNGYSAVPTFDVPELSGNTTAVSLSGGKTSTASPPPATMGGGTATDGRERQHYGTFLSRSPYGIRLRNTIAAHAELNRDDVVHIKYFNSRGVSGDHFSDVELQLCDLRQPVYLYKGRSQVTPENPKRRMFAKSPVASAAELLPSAQQGGYPHTASPSVTTTSSSSKSSKSSFLEQSLNWYWIDVSGRDPTSRRYNNALRFLTQKFDICESFLVDREHVLVLPQICESPNYPWQYLLNLRVATNKISISADSVMELTNRWIIIVDLKKNIIITLHRVDTQSMASLRTQWKRVMEKSDVSFQEFLLKVIDNAIYTYQLSLDVHADVLDKCETKLFVEKPNPSNPSMGHLVDVRILHHFAGSSRSPFLRRLLDDQDRLPMNKGEMNSFLHHLHRRTSVQHRMLNLTQVVLAKAFTKLRLCSREMADQMCGSCIELSDRALEVRDDAKTLLDLHISLQSFRTNELMAVLTRVSLLFTPVTFLAGVYGMNFQKNFPELTWEYGYPFFWVVCAVLVLTMQLFFFREK